MPESVTFESLAATSGAVAATRSRLEKVRQLSDCLQRVTAAELPVAVRFLSGELTQGKIGVGGAAVRKAMQTAIPSTAVHQPLSIAAVDDQCGAIAQVSGKGSQARRHEALVQLFSKLSVEGQRFLAGLLLGELRHGALEGVMIDALATSSALPKKTVRRAVMLTGDLSRVAQVAQEEGATGLERFSVSLFRPLQPMLAEPAEDLDAALAHLGTAALEYKLDGVRVQVHKLDDEVRVFTRHLKEVTHAVPEVVETVAALPIQRAILDGEVLAFTEDRRPHPFQVTMKRFGRSREITELRHQLPLDVVFFDCLLADRALIDEDTQSRHAAMADFVPAPLQIPRLVTADPVSARQFLEAAMTAGHEGIMAKSLGAAYAAGGRGRSWLKLKPAHTLDLVVLAAEWGSGRRKGWLSNLHLGARDPRSGNFVMIGKTFKGLTDKMLAWQTEALLQRETHRDDYTVFVQPHYVVEIAFNEVQRSPHYASGYALRFARVKQYRADKPANAADTIDLVAHLFRQRNEQNA
ncbi:MAG: ATP-dependent DNA ligase [Planctomycetota bacterium]